MTKLRTILNPLPICLALLGATPVLAHHSYAMFDRTKVVQYKAIVREWEYSSPHSYLWVYIADSQGKLQLWGIEGASPGQLGHNGWTRSTISPGDKITIKINPLRDGRNGGSLLGITTADGHSFNTSGAIPGSVGGPSPINNGPGQ